MEIPNFPSNFELSIIACLFIFFLLTIAIAIACYRFRKTRIKGNKKILDPKATQVKRAKTPAVAFVNQPAHLTKVKRTDSPKNIFLPSITPGLSEMQKSRKEKKTIPFGELNGRKVKLEFDESVQHTKKSAEEAPDINMSTFGVDDYSFDFDT